MRFGAQVKQAGGLPAALARAEAMGAGVMQVFAQSPRQWRYPELALERAAEFGKAWRSSPVVEAVVCHAPYLVNLATTDDELYARSCRTLVDNLRSASAMGAAGLVIHLGSHLGLGFEARLPRIAAGIREVLSRTDGTLVLENTAGAGGTIGRSFDELARVIEGAGGAARERLGVCVDTQHLWASGVSFGTVREADRVVAALDAAVGLDRLVCLHVNDSKVALGAGLDRHESVGRGQIGENGFRSLLGQPRLQGLPAILEVPGVDGHGPGPADLAIVRRLHEQGLGQRARVRLAKPPDRPDVHRLVQDAARWMVARGFVQWQPGAALAGRVDDAFATGETLVLRAGGKLVASVSVTWEDRFGWGPAGADGRAGYIHLLVGRGYGRRMVAAAERLIRRRGRSLARLDCVLACAKLHRLYESAGYRRVGETDFGGRRGVPRCALYEKRLVPQRRAFTPG